MSSFPPISVADPFGRRSIGPKVLEIVRGAMVDGTIVIGTIVIIAVSRVWNLQVEIVLKDIKPERKVRAVCCEVELIEGDVRKTYRNTHGELESAGDFVCNG